MYNGMTRGRQQVLYNYLPGSTFDFTGGNAICKVTDVEGKEVVDINRKKIVREMGRYIYGTALNRRWLREKVIGFPDEKYFHTGNIDEFSFEIPIKVRYELFPLVFKCPKCERVYEYSGDRDINRKNPGLVCINHCGKEGRLRQIYHVFVHECGEIKPLRIPVKGCRCQEHGEKHIRFDERRSQKSRDFRWTCSKCGREIGSVIRRCECGSDNDFMVLTPHRANITFYPHYIRMVDVSDELKGSFGRATKEENNQRILSKYLALNLPETRLSPDELDRLKMYKKELENPDIPAEMRKYLETELRKLTGNGDARGNRDIVERLELSEERLSELSEYIYVLDNLENDSMDERIERMNGEHPGSGSVLEMSKQKVEKSGFSDIHLIESFPVVTAVFGYTRVSYEPRTERKEGKTIETVIRPFNRGDRDRFPVYVDKGGTEALLFKVNPMAVANWLRKNGINVDTKTDDEINLRRWFLENVGHIDRYAELDPNIDRVTYYTFNLLHSLSHCMIGAASLISGFEKMGMAEYVFPGELAFVIYSNKTVFTIGGFHTLFERYLDELMGKCVDDPEMKLCVYDPVCISKGGSCHGCMHLPEISCSFFNRQLGRVFLYGGSSNNEAVVGFWDDMGGR